MTEPWRGIEAEACDVPLDLPSEGHVATLATLLRRAVARGVRIADTYHSRPVIYRWRDPVPVGVAQAEQSLADAIEAGDVDV